MNYPNKPFQKRVEKPWGFEVIYTPPDLERTGKILSVRGGQRLSLQYHDQKEETVCLISGQGAIWLENGIGELDRLPMEPLRGYTVAVGQKHRLEAVTDALFTEVSGPEKGTTFRLDDDYARPDETEAVRGSAGRGWNQNSRPH
ncbi:MAG: cupin [Patescibacteria group bacterium]|jgi:mannose-6-phosphate isomerase-like protein (cupin superfamily)